MGRGVDGDRDGRLVGGRGTGGLGGTKDAGEAKGAGEASGADGALILAELRARGFGLHP